MHSWKVLKPGCNRCFTILLFRSTVGSAQPPTLRLLGRKLGVCNFDILMAEQI
jgi:hypothetical protein